MMLETWELQQPSWINSTTPQINRQKSARNLMIVTIDKQNATAVFWDAKKGIGNTATLARCDCKDFSFVRKCTQKDFQAVYAYIYRFSWQWSLDSLMRSMKTIGQKKRESPSKNRQRQNGFKISDRDFPALWGEWNRLSYMNPVFKKIGNTAGILL